MVRKIARLQPSALTKWKDQPSKAKARLQVMAYVGLPPAILMLIQRADLDLAGASVVVHGRKKGGGTRPVRLPLTPHGVAAFTAFVAADAFGRYSAPVAQSAFRRAIATMCTRLEANDQTRALGQQLRAQLRDATAYDLRHSFLTDAQLATGNLRATQGLAMHADIRQTMRYTLASVAPELQAAAEAIAARARQRTANQPPIETSKNARKHRDSNRRDPVVRTAKIAAKTAVYSSK